MKYLLLAFVFTCFVQSSFAQTTSGPVEKKMMDSLCNCLSKGDVSKIKTSKEADALFSDCFSKYSPLLVDVAEEKKISVGDDDAMDKLGDEIGSNLIKQNCPAAFKLGLLMVQEDDEPDANVTQGVFKRIDLNGFNYLVINDENNLEKSFIWLRQFPGSEKFMNGTVKLVGKHVKVSWKEIELYLPAAKGYYKVKEITGVELQ
jgi:hypothetical protein